MNKTFLKRLKQNAQTVVGEGLGGNYYDLDEDKFAEIIVKECIVTIQRKIVRNGRTPENIRSYEHLEDIAKKFGITFPLDYHGIEDESAD